MRFNTNNEWYKIQNSSYLTFKGERTDVKKKIAPILQDAHQTLFTASKPWPRLLEGGRTRASLANRSATAIVGLLARLDLESLVRLCQAKD